MNTGGAARGQRAFSLIEVMVVTAIVGVVIGVIAACLTGGVRVWDRAQVFNVVETDSSIALNIMEKDLKNAFPFFGIRFAGEDQAFSFPVMVRPGVLPGPRDGESGPVPLRIGTAKYWFDGQARSLVRREWAYPDKEPVAEPAEELLADTASLRVRYYRRPAGTERGSWQDSWNDPSNLPARVSVEISCGEGTDPLRVSRTFCMPVDRARKEGAP